MKSIIQHESNPEYDCHLRTFCFDCFHSQWATTNLPEPAFVLVDGGEAVSVDSVEVVLVGNAWGDDLRVHHVALAPGAALMQRLEVGRKVEVNSLWCKLVSSDTKPSTDASANYGFFGWELIAVKAPVCFIRTTIGWKALETLSFQQKNCTGLVFDNFCNFLKPGDGNVGRVWTSPSSSLFLILHITIHFSRDQPSATLWISSRTDCLKMWAVNSIFKGYHVSSLSQLAFHSAFQCVNNYKHFWFQTRSDSVSYEPFLF